MLLKTINYFWQLIQTRNVLTDENGSGIVHSYFSISLRFCLLSRFLVRNVSDLSVVLKLAETFREIQCLYWKPTASNLQTQEIFMNYVI